jgi:glycosyltransferase involved in cell wall biosynthesis
MKWYVWSLTGKDTHVVAQNEDDLQFLNRFARRPLAQTTLTRGSGVDLQRFQKQPLPHNDPPKILFVGRLLREKGIFELVDAIRMLRATGQPFRFDVCGSVDRGNRSSATSEQCDQWLAEGLIDTLQRVDDVRPHLAKADVVVLPSYREGTPRSLLEAMAVGRPIVATDVPGCREVVEDEVNGVLVPPEDVRSLADALTFLLDSREKREQMGAASRERAENQFDERAVIATNLDVYRSMIPGRLPEGVPEEVSLPAGIDQPTTPATT